MIDALAIIDPSARIAEGVRIGPWSIIGPNVTIGEGTEIASHVVIKGNTRIGKGNSIYQFASIGEDPADKKFAGEDTWLEIGDNNIIREGATLHRGTGAGGGLTRVGSGNLMMAYVHIAHDCMVGNNTVFANNAGLSGHVQVDDWAILGGYAGVNQFLRIGAHAMVGGMTHVSHDVPAYVIVSGSPPAVRSVNTVGLERRGFDEQTVKLIREAFKVIYKRGLSLQEAQQQIAQMADDNAAQQVALTVLLNSISGSAKGIHR
ncbi:acyl-ACP--UDP-N-acetylglucosamine O-acyltransferase [Gammaproteobacteria bacterium LSUCC0112]|nr:acyl-ACP--UDP-N-acetylglucosamine O-acyltransferase [Gammaproteobacteria bacterium LSUCC0112]